MKFSKFGVHCLKTFAVVFLGLSMMAMSDVHPRNWKNIIQDCGKLREFGSDKSPKTVSCENYGQIPMAFEANQGQTDESVKAVARGNGYTVFLRPQEAVLMLMRNEPNKRNHKQKVNTRSAKTHIATDVVRMNLVGSSESSTVQYLDKQPGVSNYFTGGDSSKWRVNVPHYGKLKMGEVYPGIDVVYYGTGKQLEYDFVVKPGADPNQIKLLFNGAKAVRVEDGRLVMSTGHKTLEFKAPVVYQEKWGRKVPVQGWYQVAANGEVGFGVSEYDATHPLVIDPVLVYSTYLGGSGFDWGNGITIDTAGCAYITGGTKSNDFPAKNGGYQTNLRSAGYSDAIVFKLAADGKSLVYSTYVGGSLGDTGTGIAVDTLGCAFVTGNTSSSDFPTTTNAYQTSLAGTQNAFLFKISADGTSLLYSTYLGGSGTDSAIGIGLYLNYAYVTGNTTSSDFPTTSGAYQTSYGGNTDVFLTKISANGASLVFSTYLGGKSSDNVYGIAVGTGGPAFLVGQTDGSFPTTSGAYKTAYTSGTTGGDVFVSKIGVNGNLLMYSTYLGGSKTDYGLSVAVDTNYCAYVTGYTFSDDFPTTSGAYQTAFNASSASAFVTKLNVSGTNLIYSTYLSGTKIETGTGIAVDSAGCAYVVGSANSNDFPTTSGAYQSTIRGGYLSKLSSTGKYLVYSTYFGGTYIDFFNAVAVDTMGCVYVTGASYSSNFPTTNGAYQTSLVGEDDGFVFKLNPAGFTETVTATATLTMTPTETAVSTNTVTTTSTVTPTFTSTSTETTTLTSTSTSTVTDTQTSTWSFTSTPTFTDTATDAPASTWTSTPTPTLTDTPTSTFTNTSTSTPTDTSTGTPTNTDTPTNSSTYTSTFTDTATCTNTYSLTNTPTSTCTPTITDTPTITNTSTNSLTYTSTPTCTATATWTNTYSPTDTQTSTCTPTITDTPTITNTSTNSLTYTSTPTCTVTATCTNTYSPTDTSTTTFTPTPTPAGLWSGLGKPVLAPVPVPRNGDLCLHSNKPLYSSQWDIYDFVGESVAHVTFGDEAKACWNTKGLPPGLYMVRLNLTYVDGLVVKTWQKVMVSK